MNIAPQICEHFVASLQLQISIVEMTCYVDKECQVILPFVRHRVYYRISPSISREISDNFENANLGVRPILGSRKMSSLTTRQATNMFANESSFVAADKFCEK